MVVATRKNVKIPRLRSQRSSLSTLLRKVASAWEPRKRISTSAWAVQNIRLPSELTADPGGYDVKMRPYWLEVLECMDDPDVESITIMGDAQVGKTLSLIAMLMSRIDIGPAPAMIVYPDQKAMREGRDRIYAYSLASPTVRNRVPPQSRWNERHIEWDTMLCYLAYSGGAQTLRGRTPKNVFCTEIDVYSEDPTLGDPIALIEARVKAWEEFKLVFESTPTDQGSRISALYDRSDRRKFHLPCPLCGEYSEPRFFKYKSGPYAGRGGIQGLQTETNEWIPSSRVRQHVFYECACCSKAIGNEHKQWMIENGRWCPEGCKVEKNGKLSGKPKKNSRHVGFHLWSILSPKTTFGELGEQYLSSRERHSLKQFFNNWLGLPFRTNSSLPEWRKLGERLLCTDNKLGEVPLAAYFLTAHVDVQGDRLYYVVRAWGDGKTSWLVDKGCVRPEQVVNSLDRKLKKLADSLGIAYDLIQLFQLILDRQFPMYGGGVNDRGQSTMKVRLMAIDTNFRMMQVHNFTRHATAGVRIEGQERVRNFRGDPSVSPETLFRMTNVEKNSRTGDKYEGGLKLWGIAVSAYKEEIVSRYERLPGQLGAMHLPKDIFTDGEDYLRQIVNESLQLVQKGKKDKKRDTYAWQVIDRGLGNHYWDNEVGASCAADMVVGLEPDAWDAEKWEQFNQPSNGSTDGSRRDRAAHAEEISAR